SCSEEATYPFLSYDQQTKTAVLCGRNSVQIRPAKTEERNLEKVAERLSNIGGKVEQNPVLLSFSIDDERLVMFRDGRTLVHGTGDHPKAKTLSHRYSGYESDFTIVAERC